MIKKKIVTILGGTFNPIHNGHIICSINLLKELHLKEISFLPNNIPPHKSNLSISYKHRLIMLKLALQKFSFFNISTEEIKRKNISYTFNTLMRLRKKIGNLTPLIFVIGKDSLEKINTWENWNNFLELCHIVILPRSIKTSKKFNKNIHFWIKNNVTNDYSILSKSSSGRIYFSTIDRENISSTKIRSCIKKNRQYKSFLPNKVFNYIRKNRLYF